MFNENPFLIENDLKAMASVNRLRILKVPHFFKEEKVINKTAYELFSAKELIKEIKYNRNELGIYQDSDENEYPKYLSQCLNSTDQNIKNKAQEIIKSFGRRLGLILLTLKTGDIDNRKGRSEWEDCHWSYWQTIETVFLVGGLASGNLGELLKKHILDVFKEADTICFNIQLNDYSSIVALLGCTRNIHQIGANLVFDFGQTYIKRAIAYSDAVKVAKLEVLKKCKSSNLDYINGSINDEKEKALNLHNYMIEVIKKSFHEAHLMKVNLGNEIVISIANYVIDEELVGNGGYAKLCILSKSYHEYLADSLQKTFNIPFSIKFIHDGTAASHTFNETSNSACLVLGTAFGIGFPNKRVLPKQISKEIVVNYINN